MHPFAHLPFGRPRARVTISCCFASASPTSAENSPRSYRASRCVDPRPPRLAFSFFLLCFFRDCVYTFLSSSLALDFFVLCPAVPRCNVSILHRSLVRVRGLALRFAREWRAGAVRRRGRRGQGPVGLGRTLRGCACRLVTACCFPCGTLAVAAFAPCNPLCVILGVRPMLPASCHRESSPHRATRLSPPFVWQEFHESLRHDARGLLSMVNTGKNSNTSHLYVFRVASLFVCPRTAATSVWLF